MIFVIGVPNQQARMFMDTDSIERAEYQCAQDEVCVEVDQTYPSGKILVQDNGNDFVFQPDPQED